MPLKKLGQIKIYSWVSVATVAHSFGHDFIYPLAFYVMYIFYHKYAALSTVLYALQRGASGLYSCPPRILSDSAKTSAEYFFLRLFKIARYIK